MKHWLRTRWPILILICFELIIFFTNTVSNTYLMGWDNVMPEFNFKANIMRNLVGVWQEHRGLGLYDGMSHAASLLHTLLLWFLSFFIPHHLLRMIFILLMHLLGGIGMYISLQRFIHTKTRNNTTFLLFLGALFYLLCPITIQMFYTPLESFAIHFAALPWIFISCWTYLHTGGKHAFAWASLTILLITPQYFIPTLFIPTSLVLLILLLTHIHKWKRGILLGLTYILLNAFWLAPFLYGASQTTATVPEAKINQMSSTTAYLQNVAFGDLTNVLTMKGFPLHFEDPTLAPSPTTIMHAWESHWNTAVGRISSLVFVLLLICGILRSSISTTNRIRNIPILLLTLLAFIMLANNTPGIRELTTMVRDRYPIFAELFRFPFTKFSTLFSFGYSILVVNGILWIYEVFRNKQYVRTTASILTTLALLFLSFPIVTGQFFYKKLHVTLPQEYVQLFDSMQTLPHGRVAILPQPEYWSWKQYRFGYYGSGFLWYGIPQPLLDRAFDPWSRTNEGYYWELSYAIYSKNSAQLTRVLEKYGVMYLLVDESQLSISHARALYIDEIHKLLTTIPQIQKLNTFGSISLYSYTPVSSLVQLIEGNLPNVYVSSGHVTDLDPAYEALGVYQSVNTPLQPTTLTYPFWSLFTKRSVQERSFTIQESPNTLLLTSVDKSVSIPIELSEAFQVEASAGGRLSNIPATICTKRSTEHTQSSIEGDESIPYLHLISNHNRLCMTIPFIDLWHNTGYLVQVISRHIRGQTLTIALINKTAKHTEIETTLPTDTQWTPSYFILPPLTSDGKGYDVYLANDHIAQDSTINDIMSIRVYTIPYRDIVNYNAPYIQPQQKLPHEYIPYIHPNPAYYRFTLPEKNNTSNNTLILNETFDPGWHAYIIPTCTSSFRCTLSHVFPFLFGKHLTHHIQVNNWSNGWIIQSPSQDKTVVVIFLPQVIEWIGFLLIPIPFLLMIYKRIV